MDNSILIQNIEHSCAKMSVSPNKAFIESGVGKDFFYNVRKGQNPSIEKVAKLATYFNVSTDYLLGNEQKNKPTVNGEPVSDSVVELAKKLDQISDKGLEDIARYIDLILEHEKSDKK